ncbi:MAG: peptidase M15A, partial [Mesorhizobium sp.]
SSQMTTSQMTMTAKGDASLPEQVASVPAAKPGAQALQEGAKSDAGFPVAAAAGAETAAGQTPQPQAAQTVEQADAAAHKTETADAGTAAPKSKAGAAAPAMNNPVYVTAAEPQAYAPKKKGFLASLFSATPASAAPAPQANNRSGEQPPAAQPKAAQPKPAAKPAITLASAKP